MTDSKIEALYHRAVNVVFSAGRFNDDYLKKGLQINDGELKKLIDKMISHGVIGNADENGNYTPLKTYIHSDYLLQQELKDDAEKSKALGSKEIHKKIGMLIFALAIVVFIITCFFASREPVALILIIPSMLLPLLVTGWLRGGVGMLGVLSIAVCLSALFWVNSNTPLWGEQYTESERNNEYSRMAKAEIRKEENERLLLINYSHAAVERLLKDPSSAKFSSEGVSKSGAVCGFVNAKNSLGGYAGNQRYIYFNGATTLEDGSGDFSSKWSDLCN